MMPRCLKLTARIYCGDEIAMGPGKADLLDAIATHGSISAAGRAMGMSYRRAWLLVDTMNRCWLEPLVATSPGSAHGSGARITPLGTTVLTHYRKLQASLAAASDNATLEGLIAALAPQPRSKQPANQRANQPPL